MARLRIPATPGVGAVACFAGFAALAWTLGVLAWGPSRWPAAAVVVPLLWVLAPSRGTAAGVGAFYALAAVRFAPSLIGAWYSSPAAGLALWAGVGASAALLFGALWTRSATPWRVALSVTALLVVWLAAGAAVPGHPFFGWGFVLTGWKWLGVATMFVATAAAAAQLRLTRVREGRLPWRSALAVAVIAIAVVGAGGRSAERSAKVAGVVGALDTRWGRYPPPDSLEVMMRIGKIGQAAQSLAGGEGGLLAVVFPEAIIGRYDPSLFDAVDKEIISTIRRTGQTVVVGADVMIGQGRYANSAIVLRPDGSASWVAARQSTPVAQWRPWNPEFHIPSDWLGRSVVALGAGGKARIMFCHEEYIAALHLLSEALEDHQIVIAMTNLWSAQDGLPNAVQAAHTEGAARMFGRRWIRSVNGARPAATTGQDARVPPNATTAPH